MSDQRTGSSGQPQFVVEHGGQLYLTQVVDNLDAQDPQMQAMLSQAENAGRAVRLPDISIKSATAAGANIGNESMSQSVAGANIGDQGAGESLSAANIGDQNMSDAQSAANIGEDDPQR